MISGVARIWCQGHDDRGAEGVSVEAPKAPSGVGYREGCPLPSRLRGLGERRELPSGFRGGAQAAIANFTLKKWWCQSAPLSKVVLTSHHRHIQSCAYGYMLQNLIKIFWVGKTLTPVSILNVQVLKCTNKRAYCIGRNNCKWPTRPSQTHAVSNIHGA